MSFSCKEKVLLNPLPGPEEKAPVVSLKALRGKLYIRRADFSLLLEIRYT